MKSENKEQLINNAAARVHAAWCEEELKAYYSRYLEARKTTDVKTALEQACLKNGQKRNEVEINLSKNFTIKSLEQKLLTFKSFLQTCKEGRVLSVKRYTTRTLTTAEQKAAGKNYIDGQENILRPFEHLSSASKQENLSAAIDAAAVYIELAKRGATLSKLRRDKFKEIIGTLIHADWIKRNSSSVSSRPELFVPYDKLDSWVAGQDLTVFYALLDEVEANPKLYEVKVEKDLPSIDHFAEERAALQMALGASV